VVYNAVDEAFLNEPLPADADRILERHAATGPYVLYAGAIKPQKNLPRLIEAFAVAKCELSAYPELRDLKLLVIGEAPTRHAELRSAVVRARVREDVRFLGFLPLPMLRGFYGARAGFPLPFPLRRFRTASLEAMAHGAPVLTSNVSSLPEVFRDAALFVNPENVFDIARGIRRSLRNRRCAIRSSAMVTNAPAAFPGAKLPSMFATPTTASYPKKSTARNPLGLPHLKRQRCGTRPGSACLRPLWRCQRASSIAEVKLGSPRISEPLGNDFGYFWRMALFRSIGSR